MRLKQSILAAAITLTLAACGSSSDDNNTQTTPEVLDTYTFSSKFVADTDSVSYSGQIARHALIAELNTYISSGLESDLTNQVVTTKTEVLNKLKAYFYAEDLVNRPNVDVAAVLSATISFTSNTEQMSINDISTGKNLAGKIAGNDATGQHKNWNDGTSFVGFGTAFMTGFEQTPEGLVLALFDKLADNAIEFQTNGVLASPYVTAEGLDLQQLIQKFLLMSIAFSQGADDYLDDADAGKGLLSSYLQDGDSAYSSLEHQWDEGFGYFGAARDYLAYTDEEIAGKGGRAAWQGAYDTDADGKIDLKSEFNFGNSTNAAKRDLGSNGATDYTKDAMDAFLMGRKLINDNAGVELTTAQMTELQGYRDQAVMAWEKSIASTVVHYINDTHADITSDDADGDLAKHWSELKGFFLGLQFNPRSPLSDADFVTVNNLIGDKPVTDFTDTAAKAAYLADLVTARNTLRDAYGWSEALVTGW
ncbi:DUF4856 domain-containing protein [Catenovulum maritimum]|uniref:DUF4856 domain-containing protein n=1 Tax=Catenovulum maritimum TaxID=1513271 RepID=UPI00069DC0E6|nr:DUF4856 domain-containing protein [Catenovulum maritimum]